MQLSLGQSSENYDDSLQAVMTKVTFASELWGLFCYYKIKSVQNIKSERPTLFSELRTVYEILGAKKKTVTNAE